VRVGDAVYQLPAVVVSCLFLCLGAFACTAVRRGVENGGVRWGGVVGGVPVCRCISVPVHGGNVGNFCGDTCVGLI
jgi:hypothetical protein